MVSANTSSFSKRGLLIGFGLLAAEYIIYHLFYAYVNPELWYDEIPHKYILYITLLLLSMVAFFVTSKDDNQEQVRRNISNFSGLQTNLLLVFGLSVFCIGTFILHNIAKAGIMNHTVIGPFVDHNLYVRSAANWMNVANQVLYPVLVIFIFQGFLLNGLAKEIGFKKASIATALFYGFWYDDILGGTIFNLFLNEVYWKSQNLFYPIVLCALANLAFLVAYIINNEIWLLRADQPEYYKETVKGVLITIAMAPLAWNVIAEARKAD
ncbi:MAG TPA: CPBP family intramembrane glutamic endopeptidase [Chryseosolibacter sp.]